MRIERIPKSNKNKILTLHSSTPIVVITGLMASVLLSGVTIILIEMAKNYNILADIGTSDYILLTVVFSIIGVIAALLRMYEFKLQEDSYKLGEVVQLTSYIGEIFISTSFFIFSFIKLYDMFPTETAKDLWNNLILVIVTSALFTILFRNGWVLLYSLFIGMFSRIDWRLVIDKQTFERSLGLRFAEVKRYPAPLSLLLVAIKNYDEMVKRYGKNKITQLQEGIIAFAKNVSRLIDSANRIEDGSLIGMIIFGAGVDARYPAEKINDNLETIIKGVGLNASDISLVFSVANYDPNMKTEQDLIDLARNGLKEATEEKNIIVK